ncbi:MAG: DUF3616 domain-containing protein [Planctomycetaceae bacterium]
MKPQLLVILLAFSQVHADEIEIVGTVRFSGNVLESEDLSAIAFFGDGQFLAIGADEGTAIQILRRTDDRQFAVSHTIDLVDSPSDDEIDIEGIAYSNNGRLYVIGSHSRKRPTIKATKSSKKNRKRLESNEPEPLRRKLFELRIDNNGNLTDEIQVTSLESRIASDVILAPFAAVPSKENGVDIEGVAAVGDEVYAAFRGPVLREGHVPMLKFDFDKPNQAELLLINLGGRGIRDIARVDDGFLLIGGPVGDEPISYELYHWNGEDGVEGKNATPPVRRLGTVLPPNQLAKAEGLAVIEQVDKYYDVLVVFDGIEGGAPTVLRVKR